MNDILDGEEYVEVVALIDSQIATFINFYKDASGYLERYLIQLSKGAFQKLVARIQL